MKLFQKKSVPKKLSIKEMWKLHLMNKYDRPDVFGTVRLVFPNIKDDLPMQEWISWYVSAIHISGYGYFLDFLRSFDASNKR